MATDLKSQQKTVSGIIKHRICLLGMSFATPNLGVSALAAGCIKGFAEKFPQARLTLFDYGQADGLQMIKLADEHIPVEVINLDFSKKIWRRNHIFGLLVIAVLLKVLPRILSEKIIKSNRYLKAFAESHFVGAISGGDSFSDIYGVKRFLYVVNS